METSESSETKRRYAVLIAPRKRPAIVGFFDPYREYDFLGTDCIEDVVRGPGAELVLDCLRERVNGDIVIAVCNDLGCFGLEPNLWASCAYAKKWDVIFGNLLFVSVNEKEGCYQMMTQEVAEEVVRILNETADAFKKKIDEEN